MQIKQGSEHRLGYQSGIDHLRKALHMYPNSSLLRYLQQSTSWLKPDFCITADIASSNSCKGIKNKHLNFSATYWIETRDFIGQMKTFCVYSRQLGWHCYGSLPSSL